MAMEGMGIGAQAQQNRRGPGMPPMVSEGGRPHLGAQQASWVLVGGANTICSSPALLVLQVPSHLPLLISLVSLLCPHDPLGLEGALEGGGPAWEPSRLPKPEWVKSMPSVPLLPCSSVPGGPLLPPSPVLSRSPSYAPRTNLAQRGPLMLQDPAREPGRLPWPTGQGKRWVHSPLSEPPMVPPGVETPPPSQSYLRGTGPVWCSLVFPPSVPPRPTGSLGGSSHLLGHWGPPPASSRCPNCGKCELCIFLHRHLLGVFVCLFVLFCLVFSYQLPSCISPYLFGVDARVPKMNFICITQLKYKLLVIYCCIIKYSKTKCLIRKIFIISQSVGIVGLGSFGPRFLMRLE